jgi:hypothetical protein
MTDLTKSSESGNNSIMFASGCFGLICAAAACSASFYHSNLSGSNESGNYYCGFEFYGIAILRVGRARAICV